MRLLLVLLLAACPEPADDDDSSVALDDDDSADDDDSSQPPPTSWRSSLYPADWTPAFSEGDRFLHDFSYAGYHRGEAPLPAPAEPAASVLDFGADPTGATDSTAAIQAAIDSLSAGTLRFPEGSYRVDDRLLVTAPIVLQGEGPERTQLWFTRTAGMSDNGHISISGDVQRGPDLPLGSDAENRSTVVTLEDASSLSPGQEVALGWLITDAFIAEHGMAGTWQAFNGQWMPFFRREVVAVDGNEVTLDIPLRYPALLRDSASLRTESGYLSECGIESLALSTVGRWDSAWNLNRTHAVRMDDVSDCWVREVESFESPNSQDDRGRHLLSGGIRVTTSKRVTIADTTLGHAQNRGGGGNGYLFEILQSGEILVRDCQGVAGRHNFIQNWGFGTSGCVWLRTHSSEGLTQLSESSNIGSVGLSEFHHSLAMANLIDDSVADDGWGAVNRGEWSSGAGHSATQNVFWNLRGAGRLDSYQYGWGYVIGTEGITVQADIAEDGLFSIGEGTEPDDHLEGLDVELPLEPASLYEDQLKRRLAR